jgi:hypothetical protein
VVQDPNAKGSTRYDKHIRHNRSDIEQAAGEGSQVETPPGEEETPEEEVVDKVERKEVS